MKKIVLMITALLMVHCADANHQHRRFNFPFARFNQEQEQKDSQNLAQDVHEQSPKPVKSEFGDYVQHVGDMAPVLEELAKQQQEVINKSEPCRSTLRKKLLYVGAGVATVTGVVAGVVWLCVKKGLLNKASDN